MKKALQKNSSLYIVCICAAFCAALVYLSVKDATWAQFSPCTGGGYDVFDAHSYQDVLLEDHGNYFILGGDIVLSKENESHLNIINAFMGSERTTRGHIKPVIVTKWPDGIVPYKLIGFTPSEETILRSAMDSIQHHCTVRYIQATTPDNNYVYVITKVKRQSTGGVSTLGFGRVSYCTLTAPVTWGVALHKLLHGLGMTHTHQNYERDGYVAIDYSTVVDRYRYALNRLPAAVRILDPGTNRYIDPRPGIAAPYDYASIMHDDGNAFSKNDQKTIIPQAPVTIGRCASLSAQDKATLKTIYGQQAHYTW